MAFLVFDTETTGLPNVYNIRATPDTLGNWMYCRLVQIAWRIYTHEDNQFNLMSTQSYLIKPDGFDIPADATRIHGITTADAANNGIDIQTALEYLMADIESHNVDTLVAHNIEFDDNVILSEMHRLNLNTTKWEELDQHCTMRSNKHLFNGRWPKLNMLYTKLIGPIENANQLHSADYDCQLCAEVYMHTIE
jgi:DNA polymerase III subunit alpha